MNLWSHIDFISRRFQEISIAYDNKMFSKQEMIENFLSGYRC